MKRLFPLLGILLIFTFFAETINAQYASRKLSKKQQEYIDSIKTIEYDYIFPFLGQQAYKKGFDIPYPVGAMVNYIWMDQGIVIENFKLGIQNENINIPPTDVNEFIGFGENRNVSYAMNFRPDIWVLPFLNVYGLFGYGASTIDVHVSFPIDIKSSVTQNLSTAGIGVMGAFGLGPVWVSLDGNWTWTKPELLEEPVKGRVFGIRVGKTFTFKSDPEKNMAFWVGGMRLKMNSETNGNILLRDAIPQDVWDNKDEFVQNYYNWYDSLDPIKQAIVDKSPIPEIIDRIDAKDGSSIISYGMDKRPKQEWNMIVGGQFQINKRWMLRTEAGIVGDRKSFLASVNYRFKI